jgi:hypothetical protein
MAFPFQIQEFLLERKVEGRGVSQQIKDTMNH